MADHERLMKIVNTLVERTVGDEAEWDRLSGETYASKSGEYELRIASEDGDGEPPYRFSIHDSRHIELEALTMDELSENERSAIGERLYSLFSLARRKALGVDDAIADVERNLGIA